MAIRAIGKVRRLFINEAFLHLTLAGAEDHPEGYFKIGKDDGNYNAISALILSAAVNRYNLQVRTIGEFQDQQAGDVEFRYVVVEF